MKVYLYNPESGAPIKNWNDGTNRWSLAVGETKAFPLEAGNGLKETYGFLQVVSEQEFDNALDALDKKKLAKIKVDEDGSLVPKEEEELKEEQERTETKKKNLRSLKAKIKDAEDAEPEKPTYWELPRGDLINEVRKRELDVKGLNKKGSFVSKEQLIAYLEQDDQNK